MTTGYPKIALYTVFSCVIVGIVVFLISSRTTTDNGIKPTATSTPTSIVSATPPTTTIIPTPTVTSGTVRKSARIKQVTNDDPYYKISMTLPVSTVVSASETEIFLKDGGKTFMYIYLPYEFYSKYTYNSAVNVISSTFTSLRRFTSKKDMGNGFVVGYTTDNYAKSICEEDVAFDAVAAPCAAPLASPKDGSHTIVALCSAQSKYSPICDRIMRDITVRED